MLTRKQTAEKIHDEILEEVVRLNAEICLLRMNKKEKEKDKLIVKRNELELKLSILEREENL